MWRAGSASDREVYLWAGHCVNDSIFKEFILLSQFLGFRRNAKRNGIRVNSMFVGLFVCQNIVARNLNNIPTIYTLSVFIFL